MKNFLYVPAVLALVLTTFAAQAHDIEISDAWVRAAPPNAPALGAFMEIKNATDVDRSIVAARTSLEVERVELHRTMMHEGVMQMVPHDRIPLAAGTETKLKPGSWHVMLIGPSTVPTEGETLTLTLVFDDGSEQTIEAQVRKGKKMMHGNGHEMGHGQKMGHGQQHDCEHRQKHKQMQAHKRKHDCEHKAMAN